MSALRATWALALGLLLSGCVPSGPVCPPAGTLGTDGSPSSPGVTTGGPAIVEIGGRQIAVDAVIEGPLCDGDWHGTVYVGCDVQVSPWEGRPTFLEDCDLAIAPGTVVYVAHHRNAAYYNGCSCHTGELAGP